MRTRQALILSIFACLGIAGVRADPTEKVDYQQLADKYRWGFDEKQSDVVRAMSQVRGYDVLLRYSEKQDDFGHFTLTISRDGKEIHTWDAHPRSVFVVRDDVLYAVDYSPIATGAMVFAIDLKTGKELWRNEVEGIGLVTHSKYRNSINLDLVDGAVRILGNEAAGRYVEFKNLETGKTVGHRVVHKIDA